MRIYFRGCKFGHISQAFIFVDREILIMLCGLVFAVAQDGHTLILEKDELIAELP